MFPGVDAASLWRALEAAAEQASLAIYIARIDVEPTTLVYVSDLAAQILGRTREELIGSSVWPLFPPDARSSHEAAIHDPARDRPSSFDLRVRRPDGTDVPIRLGRTRLQADGQVFS